ncbi:MAG TPA: molybdenum cofactor biosynthesis protein MoaE [Dehalococcoidia bacterium]|nr:molybdenum cofactor biosynthesis protein MoaE [Dehalococcoidia bacterium]
MGNLFEITTEPLRHEPVVEAVSAPGVGGVVTFAGNVRLWSRGKRVSYLDYDAYPEMATKYLRQIGDEIKDRWGIEHVAIVHRIGHLEIGETSVIIAVGSPHRREAFEACHYAIDRLKEIVPIWKKEVWEDGEVWIGLEPNSYDRANPAGSPFVANEQSIR